MKVFIGSAYPASPENFVAEEARAEIARQPPPGIELIDDATKADAVLFMEHHPTADPLFLAVWNSPQRRAAPRRCLLFHDGDFVVPMMRGLYPSIARSDVSAGSCESWYYLSQHCENPAVAWQPLAAEARHLYSFVGSTETYPLRRQIVGLNDPRAYFFDSSPTHGWELDETRRAEYHRRFARSLSDSKFVLCPRGISPTSYRLLETMKAGRCPVILADDWVLPEGPPWRDFALLVPEAQWRSIPNLLREREHEAPGRGAQARKAWEAWCAPEVKYRHIVAKASGMARVHQSGPPPLWRLMVRAVRSRIYLTLLRRSLRYVRTQRLRP